MRYIFDFDDVLFNMTRYRKENLYPMLQEAGVSLVDIEDYYGKTRMNQFSLKKMLAHFSLPDDLYEKIMSRNKNFVNEELLEIVKKLGKSNCYIVSYGDPEFQQDKIKRTDIAHLFTDVIAVPGSKKEAIEKICAKYPDEKVIFIDDKAKHFEDLDFVKYPNLKTILYTGQNLENLLG